ncbi:MAG: YybH family protein [Rhodoferax sp.]
MSPLPDTLASAREQVFATERAFARTMAQRDHQAFGGFIAPDAVFLNGASALHGKAQVAQHWADYYVGPDAPFSWEPEAVESLDSGDLALSTGPVRDSTGKHIANFTSVWRRTASGNWQIVFDQGHPVCDCAPR